MTDIKTKSEEEKKQEVEELEEIVNKTDASTGADSALQSSQSQLPQLLPIDEYVGRFTSRYEKEEAFKRMVHKYLGLRKFRTAALSVSRKILPSWYKKRTDKLIRDYAYRVRRDLEKAIEATEAAQELEKAEQEFKQRKEETNQVVQEKEEAERKYEEIAAKEKQALLEAEVKLGRGKEEVKQITQAKKEEVAEKFDAEKYVKEKLQERVASSGFFIKDASGNLNFDEKKIVSKLEDMFLDEIVEGIEKGEGKGFFSKIKASFDALVSYWDEMENLDELPEVDWMQSAIYSRTKGYRLPQFPYLITGKGESRERVKTSIDTAIALDTSGSMSGGKLELARKTCLANVALMRKLNSQNKTFLAHYSSNLNEVTEAELLRKVNADGCTRTDLALDWLLSSLEGRGPSIAYLITDGYPEGGDNPIESAIKSAQKFQDYPIMLRIFLINPEPDSEKIIRQIGKAAGPQTKVIPVKDYQLAGGVIKDVSSAIGEMYDIEKF